MKITPLGLPSQSVLAILPVAAWEGVVQELGATLHRADFWRPDDLAKPIPIATIRQLLDFASRTGVGPQRLAIIPAADRMGTEAANALLKLLEEPPEGFHLMLLAETERLLPTVRSRLTVMEPPRQSATIGAGSSDLTSWRSVLSSLDPASPVSRAEASRLLYLYPLVHQGIRPETVLESVRHPRNPL